MELELFPIQYASACVNLDIVATCKHLFIFLWHTVIETHRSVVLEIGHEPCRSLPCLFHRDPTAVIRRYLASLNTHQIKDIHIYIILYTHSGTEIC
jgi:hypothetical protein